MGDIRYLTFKCQSYIPKLPTRSFKKYSKSWIQKAAKINIALRFVLRNVETGVYRYYCAKSHLLSSKTDLIIIQGKVEKFDIVEQCTQQRQNTKWRFKLILNVSIFAALQKNIPMGCLDSVLPEPLVRHTQVNCLLTGRNKQPYNDDLCLFRALTLYLHGYSYLDAHTSQLFNQNLDTIRRTFEELLLTIYFL